MCSDLYYKSSLAGWLQDVFNLLSVSFESLFGLQHLLLQSGGSGCE